MTPSLTPYPVDKPVTLLQDLLRPTTPKGAFCSCEWVEDRHGSGTTLRAAADAGRKAIGIELDEAYCEIVANRLAAGGTNG